MFRYRSAFHRCNRNIASVIQFNPRPCSVQFPHNYHKYNSACIYTGKFKLHGFYPCKLGLVNVKESTDIGEGEALPVKVHGKLPNAKLLKWGFTCCARTTGTYPYLVMLHIVHTDSCLVQPLFITLESILSIITALFCSSKY